MEFFIGHPTIICKNFIWELLWFLDFTYILSVKFSRPNFMDKKKLSRKRYVGLCPHDKRMLSSICSETCFSVSHHTIINRQCNKLSHISFYFFHSSRCKMHLLFYLGILLCCSFCSADVALFRCFPFYSPLSISTYFFFYIASDKKFCFDARNTASNGHTTQLK